MKKRILCMALLIGILFAVGTQTAYAVSEDNSIHALHPGNRFDSMNGLLGNKLDDRESVNRTVRSIVYLSTPLTLATPTSGVRAYDMTESMTDAEREALHDECERDYPNAIRRANATDLYNCHSFAWYSQDTVNNHYWIDDPSLYITDGSYVEVDFANAAQGDVICYINASGQNIHSGLISSKNASTASNNLCGDANRFVVLSKWGEYALYEHNGYECAYTTYRSEFTSPAVTVKFYQNTTHSHTFNAYNYDDFEYHQERCSCGMTFYYAHTWRLDRQALSTKEALLPDYVPVYRCVKCNYTTMVRPAA